MPQRKSLPSSDSGMQQSPPFLGPAGQSSCAERVEALDRAWASSRRPHSARACTKSWKGPPHRRCQVVVIVLELHSWQPTMHLPWHPMYTANVFNPMCQLPSRSVTSRIRDTKPGRWMRPISSSGMCPGPRLPEMSRIKKIIEGG